MGNKKIKPINTNNIFKKFICEEEEEDIRGIYVKLIQKIR